VRGEEVKAEERIFELGDTVRLRSGPYAGQTGTVVRVSAYGNQDPSGTLVMIKLANGRINPCYMSHLEKVK
jgi:transcription antitermination factor NusG